MLARQQRRRHDDSNLPASHCRDECRTQRHFGLAETDIAAHQTIHRPSRGEIVERGIDRALLVFGLLIREAGAELIIGAFRNRDLLRFAQLALGRDFHQLMSDLADAVLHPRLARLPSRAAEAVEFDLEVFRAVARQQVDILDRQIQLGLAGIMQFETVMRRPGCLDRLQPDEPADTVIDVNDKITSRQARRLGDEILRALRDTARPHKAVAEDVLFANDGNAVGFEAGFEAEHRKRHIGLRARQRLLPCRDIGEIGDAVIAQHMPHAIARAFAPQRNDDILVVALQSGDVPCHRIKDIGVLLGAISGKIVPLPRAYIDDGAVLIRHRKRRQPRELGALQPIAPFFFRKIETLRRQRFVRHAARIRRCVVTRIEIITDQADPLMHGLVGQGLKHNRRTVEIIEQCVETLVEQRQPMLHAGIAAPFAH